MATPEPEPFEKEVARMPDGRQLVYYSFARQREPLPPGAPPQPPPASEER